MSIAVKDTSTRELVITRLINAPRELVWEAWTRPEHVKHWWGPDGFTNTIHEMKVEPGGVWRFMMHGPNGMNFPNKIVFDEVIKPERLVYTHSSEDENDPNIFQTTVTFEKQGNKTNLTMRAVFATTEERDRVVKEYGAAEGGKQHLTRLEAYIKSQMNIRKQLKTTNMTRVSTYLNFPNNTEQAFLFYKSVFGGEFGGKGIQRFGDIPAIEGQPPLSEKDKKLILHIELPILGGHVLMGTDAPESMGFKVNFGNNYYICLKPGSRKETKRLFDTLSAGGNITMDLQDIFWGANYGSCTDKFGVNWMVNCTEQNN
jgi:PhnB protein